MGSGNFDYSIDLVMCIDATKSMAPLINDLKSNVKKLLREIVYQIELHNRSIEQLRVKIIAFRDYKYDAEPMLESIFFVLDKELDALQDFLNGIEMTGGGDGPENALEAMALAMKSDWVKTGYKRRHDIIVWTDSAALPLGARKGCLNYPNDMPADFAELRNLWEGPEMDRLAKRMLIFAPDTEPWSDMEEWENTIHVVSHAGEGCSDVEIRNYAFWLVYTL